MRLWLYAKIPPPPPIFLLYSLYKVELLKCQCLNGDPAFKKQPKVSNTFAFTKLQISELWNIYGSENYADVHYNTSNVQNIKKTHHIPFLHSRNPIFPTQIPPRVTNPTQERHKQILSTKKPSRADLFTCLRNGPAQRVEKSSQRRDQNQQKKPKLNGLLNKKKSEIICVDSYHLFFSSAAILFLLFYLGDLGLASKGNR